MEPPAKSPHGKRLRQDPITWVAAILFLSLIIPYLVPGVGRETLTNFSELYADIVILALVIVAFEWTDRENSPRSVQIFRHIAGGAFGLVQQNGGNIEVESEAGAGTAVRIELPVSFKETASATVDSSETDPTGPDPS